MSPKIKAKSRKQFNMDLQNLGLRQSLQTLRLSRQHAAVVGAGFDLLELNLDKVNDAGSPSSGAKVDDEQKDLQNTTG